MGEILVANGAGTSLPLLIQILPVAISGMFTLGAAIYVALRNSRAEHRRWLRQERLKTYSTFLEIASGVSKLSLRWMRRSLNEPEQSKGNPASG